MHVSLERKHPPAVDLRFVPKPEDDFAVYPPDNIVFSMSMNTFITHANAITQSPG